MKCNRCGKRTIKNISIGYWGSISIPEIIRSIEIDVNEIFKSNIDLNAIVITMSENVYRRLSANPEIMRMIRIGISGPIKMSDILGVNDIIVIPTEMIDSKSIDYICYNIDSYYD